MKKRFLFILIGFVIGLVIYHFFLLGVVIDRRADDLGMMQYNAHTDRMEVNEQYKWTLFYLKHGRMK